MSGVELTESVLRDRVLKYVSEYVATTGVACTLGIVSRRFGKQAKRFGVDITGLLEHDKRFLLVIRPSGVTNIVPYVE